MSAALTRDFGLLPFHKFYHADSGHSWAARSKWPEGFLLEQSIKAAFEQQVTSLLPAGQCLQGR